MASVEAMAMLVNRRYDMIRRARICRICHSTTDLNVIETLGAEMVRVIEENSQSLLGANFRPRFICTVCTNEFRNWERFKNHQLERSMKVVAFIYGQRNDLDESFEVENENAAHENIVEERVRVEWNYRGVNVDNIDFAGWNNDAFFQHRARNHEDHEDDGDDSVDVDGDTSSDDSSDASGNFEDSFEDPDSEDDADSGYDDEDPPGVDNVPDMQNNLEEGIEGIVIDAGEDVQDVSVEENIHELQIQRNDASEFIITFFLARQDNYEEGAQQLQRMNDFLNSIQIVLEAKYSNDADEMDEREFYAG